MKELSNLRYKGNFDDDLDKKSKSQTHSSTTPHASDILENKLQKIDIDQLKRDLPVPRSEKERKTPKFKKSYSFIELDSSIHESEKVSARLKKKYLKVIKETPRSHHIKQGRGGLGDQIGQVTEDMLFFKDHMKSSWETVKAYLNKCLDSERRANTYLDSNTELEFRYLKELKENRSNLITTAKVMKLYEYETIDKLRTSGIIDSKEYEDFIYLT